MGTSDLTRWQRAAIDAAKAVVDDLLSRDLRVSLEAMRARARQAVQPVTNRFRHAQRCIDTGAREVFFYLLHLDREKRLGGKGGPFHLDYQIAPAIRARLEAELTGDEVPEEVTKMVRRFVREELAIRLEEERRPFSESGGRAGSTMF